MSKTFALPPGIIASSMTPFDADGRPKLNAIRPHIDWLIDQGVAGISKQMIAKQCLKPL
jgi:dihydrodipicolinate synthase/N-acetylneuraminate lyase